MRYAIFYCGGEGPDVWDKEDTIDAVDIDDALSQAHRFIEDNSGWIYSIEQFEYPSQSARHQLKLCEEHAATMAKDFDASLAVVQTERDSLRSQLQTAMEERDATAKDAIKKLIDVKVLLSGEPKLPIHAIDIINDLMTRLSTSRETENKTDE